MPRVLKIDSITNRPICKTAGAGGFSGHNYLCHSKARIGLMGQCKMCDIPALGINKMVGCGNPVPCGNSTFGTGWDFDLVFGTGSSYAATQSNDGTGNVENEWASITLNGMTGNYTPFKYKWSTGSTSAGVNNLGPGPAGTYSVTVTDKYGKSKTKNMPAIYTRFITLPELEAYGGSDIISTTGSWSAGDFQVGSNWQDAQGVGAIVGGIPPYKVGFHVAAGGGTVTDASRIDLETVNPTSGTPAWWYIVDGYNVTDPAINNTLFTGGAGAPYKPQAGWFPLSWANGSGKADNWTFMGGGIVGDGLSQQAEVDYFNSLAWFMSLTDSSNPPKRLLIPVTVPHS